jgi:hypothetical protein
MEDERSSSGAVGLFCGDLAYLVSDALPTGLVVCE